MKEVSLWWLGRNAPNLKGRGVWESLTSKLKIRLCS
jgi:hypothetical protein